MVLPDSNRLTKALFEAISIFFVIFKYEVSGKTKRLLEG